MSTSRSATTSTTSPRRIKTPPEAAGSLARTVRAFGSPAVTVVMVESPRRLRRLIWPPLVGPLLV